MTVSRTIKLADLTPAELAELFCEMDSDQQAEFFAGIKLIAAKWPGAGWCQQSHEIARSLDADGREVIEKLAEHVLGYDELVAALAEARRAIGDHSAPSDCYATGPLTGDAYRDLVECPACSFLAKHDAMTAEAALKAKAHPHAG